MPYLDDMPRAPIHVAAASRNPGPVAMNRDEADNSVPVSDARLRSARIHSVTERV